MDSATASRSANASRPSSENNPGQFSGSSNRLVVLMVSGNQTGYSAWTFNTKRINSEHKQLEQRYGYIFKTGGPMSPSTRGLGG